MRFHRVPVLSFTVLFAALATGGGCSSSSSGAGSGSSGGGISGSCTYVAPVSGPPGAAACYTYENAPPGAATGGSGLCPSGSQTVTVTTVSSCPATLGSPPLQQLGTCTVLEAALPPASSAWQYTILYYAGQNTPTCHKAAQGCADQKTAETTPTWAGIGGCN